jgi:hypothetical protein
MILYLHVDITAVPIAALSISSGGAWCLDAAEAMAGPVLAQAVIMTSPEFDGARTWDWSECVTAEREFLDAAS